MKILKSLTMVLIVALAPSILCAQKSNQTSFEKISSATSSARGLLFRISGRDLSQPSYIFGTLHAVCPNDLFEMRKLSPYFDETARLYLELDFDDPQVIGKASTALDMPEGKTLRDFLTPEKYARVDEMFRHLLGVRVSAFGRVSPLGLSAIVSGSPQAVGCRDAVSYETKFVEMAKSAGKEVEGLESVEEQLAALNIKPLEKQAEDLYKLSLDPQKPINEFKDLIAVYKKQDAEQLFDFISRQTAADPQLAANMLTARNRKWLPKIESVMAQGATFIAVGGGHLGGANGVVKLLKEKGYRIEAIKF